MTDPPEPGSCHTLPDDLDSLSWLVAVTNLAAERRASLALERNRLVAYCPMEVRPVVRHHRRTLARRPLLPRYVFVGFEPETQGPHQLRSLDGIEGVVRIDQQPITIPPSTVKDLVDRELAGEFDRSAAEAQKPIGRWYHPGDPVKAVHGPFFGIPGHVLRCFKSGNVDVLMNLFGRQTRTRFHADDLTMAAGC